MGDTIATRTRDSIRLLAVLATCALPQPGIAQDAAPYALHAQSNLILVDVTAVDRSSYVPDRTLTRNDLQVFDNGRAVGIRSLDQGSDTSVRPVLLWIAVQCSMTKWTEEGSGFFAGKGGSLAKGLTHLHRDEMVGVVHWCDTGDAAIDLRPTDQHEAALPVVNGILSHVVTRPNRTRAGELALQTMIRLTQEESRRAAPGSMPVLLFLHGDMTGVPTTEIEKLLGELLESLSTVYLVNDGAMRSWDGVFRFVSERSRVLAYLASETGGTAIATNAGDPDAYSEALGAILDRLHGRYQISFVPPTLDGRVHTLKVELTAEAKRSHPRLLLRSRAEYRAPRSGPE